LQIGRRILRHSRPAAFFVLQASSREYVPVVGEETSVGRIDRKKYRVADSVHITSRTSGKGSRHRQVRRARGYRKPVQVVGAPVDYVCQLRTGVQEPGSGMIAGSPGHREWGRHCRERSEKQDLLQQPREYTHVQARQPPHRETQSVLFHLYLVCTAPGAARMNTQPYPERVFCFRCSAPLIHDSHSLSPLLDHVGAEKNFYSDMDQSMVLLVKVEAISRSPRHHVRASSHKSIISW
jgi:hypothetical protein